jgi:hypothetical protein
MLAVGDTDGSAHMGPAAHTCASEQHVQSHCSASAMYSQQQRATPDVHTMRPSEQSSALATTTSNSKSGAVTKLSDAIGRKKKEMKKKWQVFFSDSDKLCV